MLLMRNSVRGPQTPLNASAGKNCMGPSVGWVLNRAGGEPGLAAADEHGCAVRAKLFIMAEDHCGFACCHK